MDHVASVLADHIHVVCAPGCLLDALLTFGARTWDGAEIPAPSKQALALALTRLQQLQIPFGDAPSGWPPAAVFAQLRDEGLVSGAIVAVSWEGPGRPIVRAG